MPVSQSNEFDEFRQFMEAINLSEIGGINNKIFSVDGMEIASVTNNDYAQGLVQSHYRYMLSISLLEEIKDLTNNPVIKEKIEVFVINCIG